MRENRSAWLGLAGPLAALLFLGSVAGFAASRTDGYSHGTKAISELGAVGAPAAAAFNVLGFAAPGLLIIVLAVVLHRRLSAGGAAGPILLGLSGLALAAAGLFPVDMEARASATSIGHLVAAQAAGFLWAGALFPLGRRMQRTPGFSGLGRVTPWFVLFLLVNIAWQVAWQATGAVLPGWGQRIAFAGYFAWTALAGLAALRRSPHAAES